MHNFPKQRLSYTKKSENDFKWAKEVIDAILTKSPQQTDIVNAYNTEYGRKLSNYRLYNNELDQADFHRECNPLGLDVNQFKDVIMPYNKTYNKIQVLLSDEAKRPFNFRSILTNSDGIRSKIQHRDAMFRNYIYSQLQNTLKSLETMYPPDLLEDISGDIMPPEDVSKYMKYDYRERREILGEKILQYLQKKLDIKDVKNDGFKHGLISGEEIIYVGVNNGEPFLSPVNSLGAFYHKSGEQKWIQKSLYAGCATYMNPGEVLDAYGRYMTEEDANKIDSSSPLNVAVRDFKMSGTMKYGHQNPDPMFQQMFSNDHGSYGKSHAEDILVQHVEWVSQKKIGFLTFTNEFEDEETMIVSEDFIVPEEAEKIIEYKEFKRKVTYYTWASEQKVFKLTWDYIPEVWTGTKIGQDIYVMIGPKEDQFRTKDNPYEVSLGYHGLIYNAMNAAPVSLMDRMKPFQYLYFIVMHKLKKLIAQDQGKVFPFDVSMVDPKVGIEKTLYYLKDMNLDIYNPLANGDQPGQSQRGKVTSSIDMSNMQFILNYVNVLAAIDAQISEVAGVSRQREGQTAPTEAVTNAQANIQMSALITEIYFSLHSKLWEKCLTSLIQVTRTAWKGKNIVKQYVLDDSSLATLELSGDDLMDCDLGVFVTDSGREHEMFQALKGISDGLLNTNRATFSDLITLYEATSASELKAAIQASEEKFQAQQNEQAQAELQAQAEAQRSQQDFELEKQAREHEHEVLIANIESFQFQKDQDANDNGTPDQFEVQKFLMENKIKERKLSLEEAKLKQDKELTEKELKIKARKPSSSK
jgi:hypothetical protein